MRGHWQSQTRKLNRHYQSLGAGGEIPAPDSISVLGIPLRDGGTAVGAPSVPFRYTGSGRVTRWKFSDDGYLIAGPTSRLGDIRWYGTGGINVGAYPAKWKDTLYYKNTKPNQILGVYPVFVPIVFAMRGDAPPPTKSWYDENWGVPIVPKGKYVQTTFQDKTNCPWSFDEYLAAVGYRIDNKEGTYSVRWNNQEWDTGETTILFDKIFAAPYGYTNIPAPDAIQLESFSWKSTGVPPMGTGDWGWPEGETTYHCMYYSCGWTDLTPNAVEQFEFEIL